MGIKGVDHIVVRVKDIDEGTKTYRDKLGMTLDRTDESAALGIKQAFFQFEDGGFLEVVAALSPDTPVGKAMERNGEGVHTVSFAVDDMDASVKGMQDAGVQLIGVGTPQV